MKSSQLPRFERSLLLHLWNKHSLAYLLWPLSVLYRGLMWVRRKLYQWHIKGITRFSVPVIVIGNITVGGSGKTPLLIEIARFLQQQGWRPGIISRGYGGKAKQYPYRVHRTSHPCEVGDEPLLLLRRTACPTVVDPQRSRGVKALLRETNCNIILSDDGLQHLALGRHVEIVVIDGQRRFGNGFCLPAGPLREPVARLKTVDFIVNKGQVHPHEFTMLLVPEYFYSLVRPDNKKNADYFYGKTLHAVAGIGHPDQFFSCLRTLGLTIIEHPFPDHAIFTSHHFNYGKEAIIVMTEKDAVKCEALADDRLWCLRVKAKLHEAFYQALLKRVTLSSDPRSFAHSSSGPFSAAS